MGAREQRTRLAAGLALGLLALIGCRAATAPLDGAAPLPPQTVVAPPTALPPDGTPDDASQVAPATPPLPEPTPPPASSERVDPAQARARTLIVIDTADDQAPTETQDLASAARREKERRRATDKPIAVIDQKNLATWASGGVLTQAAEVREPSPAESAATETVEKAAVEEAYWRRRGHEIRQRWHDAEEQIAVLEAKSDTLRTRFYSTDDGYVRDSQVKPEWDKAIADLEEARYRSSRGGAEVLAYLEEGRKAGALPGWLREGVELEPEPVIESVTDPGAPLEAHEPVIYRDPQSEPEPAQPPPGR